MEYSKAVIDCMLKLRRALRDEFAVDIALSRSDAIQAMLVASEASCRDAVKSLAAQLGQLSGIEISRPEIPKHQPLNDGDLYDIRERLYFSK